MLSAVFQLGTLLQHPWLGSRSTSFGGVKKWTHMIQMCKTTWYMMKQTRSSKQDQTPGSVFMWSVSPRWWVRYVHVVFQWLYKAFMKHVKKGQEKIPNWFNSCKAGVHVLVWQEVKFTCFYLVYCRFRRTDWAIASVETLLLTGYSPSCVPRLTLTYSQASRPTVTTEEAAFVFPPLLAGIQGFFFFMTFFSNLFHTWKQFLMKWRRKLYCYHDLSHK